MESGSYAASPNSSATNAACPIESPLATHRTRPFRIMFHASIPCNVGYQLGHVFISQGVWEVPTDALHDHLTGKMAAFEGIGGRDRHAPPRYQTPPPNFATEPVSLYPFLRRQTLQSER